jgi:tetratricopeptide (TPR) repeat protein
MTGNQRRSTRDPRTLLEQLIREREATYGEQVDEFNRLAREHGEHATMTVRHLQRLAAGQGSANGAAPSTRRVTRTLYGRSLDELLGPPVAAIPPAGPLFDDSTTSLNLENVVTLADSADVLAQLTSMELSASSQLDALEVVPEAWRAGVVRWLLDPEGSAPVVARERELTPVDVEIVRSATSMFSGWDYQCGGGRSRLLIAQCLATEALPLARQTNSNSALGRQYLAAVSALTRLAGWSAYDIGYHGVAQRFLTLALNLAREAGDRALGGRILAGMSHQANYLGQHQRAVELARAAYEGARGKATPTALALFHAMEARALAMLGDEPSSTNALVTAEDLLAQSTPADDPDWIRFFDAAELHAEFAHCFRDLDRADLAAEHATRSIQESDSMYVRSLSFCRTVLATAHLQSDDLEQALEVARGVVDTAVHLRSHRVTTYLDDFRERLEPFATTTQVRVFDEYVDVHLPRLELVPAAGRGSAA